MLKELIETLWNVNVFTTKEKCIEWLRINRNIVECKLKSGVEHGNELKELIETLWNVNIPYVNPDDFGNVN